MPARQLTIVWFRQDLRIHDNPALFEAAKNGQILPVYILEDEDAKEWAMGAASRVWRHHALVSLDQELGGNLHIFQGKAIDILANLVKDHNVRGVYWNRCYEPWRITVSYTHLTLPTKRIV